MSLHLRMADGDSDWEYEYDESKVEVILKSLDRRMQI
jgi:hypothetical protein